MTHRAARRPELSRRDLLRSVAGAVALPVAGALAALRAQDVDRPLVGARPGTPALTPEPGLQRLGLGAVRDGNLYVPSSYSPDRPAPLLIGLHGSGGRATDFRTMPQRAERRGMVFLAPESRGPTWDVVLGGFGPDVEFLDLALRHTFARCRIDPRRLALLGWSDGATYALSLGASNGDLFTHLIALAPGAYAPGKRSSRRPRMFIAHGTRDAVLPIENTRYYILTVLRGERYDVTYREFEGPHSPPEDVVEAALDWFLAGR